MRRAPKSAVAVAAIAAVAAVLIPAGGAAAKTTLRASMNGNAEVPKGDPNGRGTARITTDSAKGRVCYSITLSKVGSVAMGHIHKGEGQGRSGLHPPLREADHEAEGLRVGGEGAHPRRGEAPCALLRERPQREASGRRGARPAAALTTGPENGEGRLDGRPSLSTLLDEPPSGLLEPEGPVPAPEGGVSRCGLRQRGPAIRSLSGRTPPGSRKNCHSI
jgi:hypothetical protein